ncbi:MAG TPA: hypothetical protein VEA19_05275 [Actinomycetota bacterium]|nr:hypothetical protein [Actinomycetota bacterium]
MSGLAELAARVGARDMFVLHRVDGVHFVNLDGEGRGAGWAGNLKLEPGAEPWIERILEDGLARVSKGVPSRIFGPYWGTDAVGLAVEDGLVIFGGEGITRMPDESLRAVAVEASSHVREVPVAKRLADELEVSQAALGVATQRPASLDDACVGIATRAAQSLSCEFGAVFLAGEPPRVFLAREGWRPLADDEEIVAALMPLHEAMQGELLVEQDLSCSPFPHHPLAFEDGLVARAAAPLGAGGSLGLLVVAHASSAPRGFTSLCQRVIVAIARAAEPMLEAALREEREPSRP